MVDDYIRRRMDQVAVGVAVTRSKVEAIEQTLAAVKMQFNDQETRLIRVERRVFTLWLLGPIALGATVFLKSFKSWLTE